MRWFWLFIALLAVLTGVLYTQRVRAERAQQAAMQAQTESSLPSTMSRRSRQRDATPATPLPDAQPQTAAAIPEPDIEPERIAQQPTIEPGATEQAADTVEALRDDQSKPQENTGEAFDPSALITRFNEIAQQPATDTATNPTIESDSMPDPGSQPETTVAEPSPLEQALAQAADQSAGQSDAQPASQPGQAVAPPPSYEMRPDGSFRILDANIWVQGAGTAAEPYVLGWDALKSIEQRYDPKSGKDKVPDWLDYLDGKVVQIEGNTLVPVVATTTRELLIMKNPWDGCCIGVPPTPFDAVEVVLNHDVDFGNSAVGFGSVQGTFYLDPYVVDGWVLGLYIVEDGTYRSGEGVVFPEF